MNAALELVTRGDMCVETGRECEVAESAWEFVDGLFERASEFERLESRR